MHLYEICQTFHVKIDHFISEVENKHNHIITGSAYVVAKEVFYHSNHNDFTISRCENDPILKNNYFYNAN